MPDVFGSVALGLGFSSYDVSYAASFVMMLGVFAFTTYAIAEEPRPMTLRILKKGVANVPLEIKDASLLALKHPTLSVLLIILALFLVATNPVEVIWPTHAKPMLGAGYDNTVIGFLTASYFFAIAFGAWLSPSISRIFRRRHALTLAATFACLAFVQTALALQSGIVGFAAVFILYAVFLGVAETPASSVLHSCVEDRQRSTMLSLRSLMQQLGAAFGLLIAGAIAELYSASVAWIFGVGFLVIAATLTGVLVRRLDKLE